MKLYDEVVLKCKELMEKENSVREFSIGPSHWPEVLDQSMILRSDMAYELGAEPQPAIGLTVITSDEKLVSQDRLRVIGKDLPEIKENAPFARVAMILVDESALGEGEKLYRTIRNLEYTRYHFYPEGFMLRVSSSKQKESVRVGKKALEEGLTFEKTGNQMIEAFRKNELVKKVDLCYITADTFDYKLLAGYAKESENITKTIDHIMKNVMTDCKACSLQEICDEVEGLRELHFAK